MNTQVMNTGAIDTPPRSPSQDAWTHAVLAATLFAIDPCSVGGVVVRGAPGPVRDAWFVLLRALLPPHVPFRRAPLHVSTDRLLGGLDLGATLATGAPVLDRGVLTQADGGVVIAAMAERWTATDAAHIAAALDNGEIIFDRDGFRTRLPARFGLIAIDEGGEQDPRPPAAWLDRLAFDVDLRGVALGDMTLCIPDVAAITAARARVNDIPPVDDRDLASLCMAALKLGVVSLRAPSLALAAARLSAAQACRASVTDADLALAARLVLAPRATVLPEVAPQQTRESDEPQPHEPQPHEPASSEQDAASEAPSADGSEATLEDIILAAVLAAVPGGLLASARRRAASDQRASVDGQAGALRHSAKRGKSVGVRPLTGRSGARINLLATLRAAAPWQKLRQLHGGARSLDRPRQILVQRDDLRANRFKQRSGSTIVFAVDASGSSALHRLAEAKGAVETLLAECYVRRDHVALVSFRGSGAEVLLARSKSLARAKRSLAGLPGGGGTPLAGGIDAAAMLALQARRAGDTPLIVLMTDGRANVTRTGQGGRLAAQEEAVSAARRVRGAGIDTLLIDTSPQPNAFAARIAADMGGRYVQLPYADAKTISAIITSERL